MEHVKTEEYFKFTLQEMKDITRTIEDGFDWLASAKSYRTKIKEYSKKAVCNSIATGKYFNPKDQYL